MTGVSGTGEPGPMIELRRVSKVYRAGAIESQVLQDCSLTIDAGCFAVLFGVSGSGKTSLLNIIGGLDTPSAGDVVVAGNALGRASRAELTRFRRRTVGFVFQFYNLLPTLTAIENVEVAVELLGLGRRATRQRAAYYLERLGLGTYADRFPAQLSGGQQQRVAIARALAKEPALVLADEPTGNLDARAAADVIERLQHLQRETGTTVVVATHNADVADVANVVLRIVDGRLHQVARPGAPLAGAETGAVPAGGPRPVARMAP